MAARRSRTAGARRRPVRRPASACTTSEGGRGDGLRVYAGLRSDPFFIDLPAFLGVARDRASSPSSEQGRTASPTRTLLGLVVEVDCELLLQRGGGPLLGVVGETVVAGKLPIRIDRFGRPEIKNVIMGMKKFDQVNRDLEIRDLYNLEDAFHMSKDYRGAYRARLNANLAVDRSPGRQDRLAARGRKAPTR